MIDTHAHIQLSDYDGDRDQVVMHAHSIGVGAIVCIGSNRDNSQTASSVSNTYVQVFYTIGLHPKDGEDGLSIDQARIWIQEMIAKKTDRLVAIGECGLDYNIEPLDEVEKVRQKDLFCLQLEYAHAYGLPVVFHVNKAYDEVLEILKNEKEQGREYRGVFHFYTGGKKRIAKIIELGDYYFGIGGAATYDDGLKEVAAIIPLDRILLETDCPYVAPEPHRGERSQPAYVRYVAEKIAHIKGVSVDEISQLTDDNAKRLFAIDIKA